MVAEGQFRQDLFFRLNVGRVQIASLRERAEDIPLLLDHFLRMLTPRMRSAVQCFSPEAIEFLSAYDWPGNVRELRNVVESALIYAGFPEISAGELPEHIRRTAPGDDAPGGELHRLLGALTAANWNKSKAAAATGSGRA